jgi:hypothetical protein
VLELLRDVLRRETIKVQLAQIIASLGEPGAAGRAANAVAGLLDGPRPVPPNQNRR